MARIGFLYNHDQTHQVAHSLPVALALARAWPTAEVVLAVTTDRLLEEITRIAGADLGLPNLSIRRLSLEGAGRRLAARASRWLVPSEKILLLGGALPFFRSLDALVVSEKTSLLLKTRYGLDGLKIIHTRHGAGDRAIGYDKASSRFDLVLASGDKIAERLARQAGVPRERIRIVGYPKFDMTPGGALPFEPDGRPVVLYNPHVSPRLSSWYRKGRAVLDWFARHPNYRLIFAPHVSLFARRFAVSIAPPALNVPGTLPGHISRAPNILIDLGSARSTDMTYTDAADIYLGDVSSQVYEFLRRPRPCIFLDAHRAEWAGDPDYLHWSAGQVIRSVDELPAALAAAPGQQAEQYEAVQRDLLARTFSVTERPSSARAAEAIADFLGLAGGHDG